MVGVVVPVPVMEGVLVPQGEGARGPEKGWLQVEEQCEGEVPHLVGVRWTVSAEWGDRTRGVPSSIHSRGRFGRRRQCRSVARPRDSARHRRRRKLDVGER